MIIKRNFSKKGLYNQYVKDFNTFYESLLEFFPNYMDISLEQLEQFMCPICQQFYPPDFKIITAEHVPQDCLGGNKLTLLCKSCNEKFGDLVDIPLRNKIKLLNVEKRLPDSKCKIKIKNKLTGKSSTSNVNVTENSEYLITPIDLEEQLSFNTDFFQYLYEKLNGRMLTIEQFQIECHRLTTEYISLNVSIEYPPFKYKSYTHLKPYIGLLKNAYLMLFSRLGYLMFHFKEIRDINKILRSAINEDKKDQISTLLNIEKSYYFLFDNFIEHPFNVDYEHEGISVIMDEEWLSFLVSFKLYKKMFYVFIPIGDFNFKSKIGLNEKIKIDFTIEPLMIKLSPNKWNYIDNNIEKLGEIMEYKYRNKLPL